MADQSSARSVVGERSPPSAFWPRLVDTVGGLNMAGAIICGVVPLLYIGLRSSKWKRMGKTGKGKESLKRSQDDSHSALGYCGSLSNSVSAESLSFTYLFCSSMIPRRLRSATNEGKKKSKIFTITDSSLLRKHSENISVTIGDYTYPSVRVFYRVHPKASALPPKLPLLVFLHGLGGQMAQYQYLLEYFVHISHTLAIDLPGCGPSEFSPEDWDAYTTSRLAATIAKIVNQKLESGQKVVLIGHSMGCALAVTLAAKGGLLADKCVGLVAICPKAIFSEKERNAIATALALPEFAFNLFRVYDRWGGANSKSVTRFIGPNASEQARKLQLRFNEQSRTPVWRRMIGGLRLPTEKEWASISCPIYLLGAAEDKVTPTTEVDLIHSWFDPAKRSTGSISAISIGNSSENTSPLPSPSPPVTTKLVVKKCIIPDAGHGVMYESPQVLCGLIGDFISGYVTEVLSLGWQLLYLKEDKWLLKNLEKWARIESVSPRIGGHAGPSGGKYVKTPFRAMKTLRQNDPNGHNPAEFSAKWLDVRDVIDISHEQPPYDPGAFGSDIRYHKFPTVSKIPPTPDEVDRFIRLVDSIRQGRGYDDNMSIACHCHYGFNRTGFFLCCYMIQRSGFSVEQAIQAFKDARQPGIRHPHFINELFERNCVGLVRTPTL